MIKSILDLLNEEDKLVKELNETKDPKEYNKILDSIKYVRECIHQKVATNVEVNHLKYMNISRNMVPTQQHENTSLISKDDMIQIFKDFLKDKIVDVEKNDGHWSSGHNAHLFFFTLYNGSSIVYSLIGSRLRYENDELIGYDIYNTCLNNRNCVNIKIRNSRIKFIEDSEFVDFSKDEMRKLYEMIVDKIHGNTSQLSHISTKSEDTQKKYRLFISQAFTGKDDVKIMIQRANLYQLFCFYKHLKPEDVELIEQHLPDDPYDIDENFENQDMHELYRFCRSVGMLGKATDVIFYGDWENSRGANLERDICEKYNIDFIDNKDLVEFCKNSNDTNVNDLFEKLYPDEFDKMYETTDGFTEDDDK